MLKRVGWWLFHAEYVRVGRDAHVGYFVFGKLAYIGAFKWRIL